VSREEHGVELLQLASDQPLSGTRLRHVLRHPGGDGAALCVGAMAGNAFVAPTDAKVAGRPWPLR
jgi:hypothetical protein